MRRKKPKHLWFGRKNYTEAYRTMIYRHIIEVTPPSRRTELPTRWDLFKHYATLIVTIAVLTKVFLP